MECDYESPYGGQHDTEFCNYLGCSRVEMLRRALQLFDTVEKQLKDRKKMKDIESDRMVAEIVIP